MTKVVTKFLTRVLVCVSLSLSTTVGVYADNHQVSNVGSGINYTPEYRTERSAWNKNIRNGRVILDELAANKGTDNILNSFNWQNLEQKSDYAAHWIKQQDNVKFQEVMSDIEESSDALGERANEIEQLRNAVDAELSKEKVRWNELMKGSDIEEYLLKALGIKVAGKLGSDFFSWLGKKFGSKLATGAGKIIGPISTLVSVYQFFKAYDQYAEMKLMLDRMLEKVEMVAYLNVLIKKYDSLIAAHDKIVGALFDAYDAQSEKQCQ